MTDELDTAPRTGPAALKHLTGPSRGSVSWLGASSLKVFLDPSRVIHTAKTKPGEALGNEIAHLNPVQDSYIIEAVENHPVWVNGIQVTRRQLESGDMIEFGNAGPMSRFRLYPEDKPLHMTVMEILGDGFDYLKLSRQPFARRVMRAGRQLLRQLTRETTILFRTTMVVAILALALLVYQQNRLNVQLQQQLESGTTRLDSFAGALARARDDALTPADLNALRQELRRGLVSNAERLKVLEERHQAAGRVIAEALPFVAFLQGSYGFRERSSQRLLRHAINVEGRPLISPRGQPMLTLEGEGPVAERLFTGTGFVAGEQGALVTNRHVALPWEGDANVEALAGRGLDPVMIKFIAFLPGKTAAGDVELLRASEVADLAILRQKDVTHAGPGLRLAEEPPAPGDEVIVMGYPTGLRSMLAQSGDAFLDDLLTQKNLGFWSVAASLAEKGHMAPLASRGIVGQVTEATIAYDAETTHGGSGGPVLNIDGAVVAVNAAILPEFGGSNLGVPVYQVRALLNATD